MDTLFPGVHPVCRSVRGRTANGEGSNRRIGCVCENGPTIQSVAGMRACFRLRKRTPSSSNSGFFVERKVALFLSGSFLGCEIQFHIVWNEAKSGKVFYPHSAVLVRTSHPFFCFAEAILFPFLARRRYPPRFPTGRSCATLQTTGGIVLRPRSVPPSANGRLIRVYVKGNELV